MRKLAKFITGIFLVVLLVACGGGGGSPGATSGSSGSTPNTTTTTTPTTTTTTTPSTNSNSYVISMTMAKSASSVVADGITTVTFSVKALDSGNAVIPNAVINFAVDKTSNAILSAGSVLTNQNGTAFITVIASAADQSNRAATITASCTECNASSITGILNITGASIAVVTTNTNLVADGANTVLTATVRDATGAPIASEAVGFGVTDSNILRLGTTTAVTNSSGQVSTTVSGIAAGNASVNTTALKTSVFQNYVVTAPALALAFTSPATETIITTNIGQKIVVSAPGASAVTFASTLGTFSNGLSSQVVSVVNGTAGATLTASRAGSASVNVVDNLGRNAALTIFVSPPVSAANKLILNAAQTTIPISTVNGESSVLVTARATSFDGTTDQPVANVPVLFAISGGPGAGESLSPAIGFTNSSGNATATFKAGTAVSIAQGISISAKISRTDTVVISTGKAPSGNNLLMTIGGRALSVAFGRAPVVRSSTDNTLYIQDYSVQVTDAANNPVSGAVVTLRLKPFAFAVGGACNPTATYCSEDQNGNDSLDEKEDGKRKNIGIAELSYSASVCPNPLTGTSGTEDGLLTPQNSDGGSVPSTVTTDANGVAPFTLTYLKASAFWVVNRLTATVSSNGTESSSFSIFRLQASTEDAASICTLPASRYAF